MTDRIADGEEATPLSTRDLDRIAAIAGAKRLDDISNPPPRGRWTGLDLVLALLFSIPIIQILSYAPWPSLWSEPSWTMTATEGQTVAPSDSINLIASPEPPSDVSSLSEAEESAILAWDAALPSAQSEVSPPPAGQLEETSLSDAEPDRVPAWRSLASVISPMVLRRSLAQLKSDCSSGDAGAVAKCNAMVVAAMQNESVASCVPLNESIEDLRSAMIQNLDSWQKRGRNWTTLKTAEASIYGYYCPTDETDP